MKMADFELFNGLVNCDMDLISRWLRSIAPEAPIKEISEHIAQCQFDLGEKDLKEGFSVAYLDGDYLTGFTSTLDKVSYGQVYIRYHTLKVDKKYILISTVADISDSAVTRSWSW